MKAYIIPYYCHVTRRAGFAIIDEFGCLTGDFFPTLREATKALKHLTNKTN